MVPRASPGESVDLAAPQSGCAGLIRGEAVLSSRDRSDSMSGDFTFYLLVLVRQSFAPICVIRRALGRIFVYDKALGGITGSQNNVYTTACAEFL